MMGEPGNRRNDEQIIDISRSNNGLSHEGRTSRIDPLEPEMQENQASSRSLSRHHSSNSLSMRIREAENTRQRSPLNSSLWISVEFVFIMGQILAAIVVLALSRNEKPEAPLFTWVVGYASGCVGMILILYYRYYKLNQSTEQDANQSITTSSEPTPHRTISLASADENQHRSISASTNNPTTRSLQMNGLVAYIKVALDCFFAIWFIVGNVWFFGDHSSSHDAPTLYRLCLVFLIISFIGYAMPFILCATICCCLPCIITALGSQEDVDQNRGATLESINALPTYKFKMKGDINIRPLEDGVLAAETENHQPEEAAACCICLAQYDDDDELKELPCVHTFHAECIDKWLQINATCPLCKIEVGTRSEASISTTNTN